MVILGTFEIAPKFAHIIFHRAAFIIRDLEFQLNIEKAHQEKKVNHQPLLCNQLRVLLLQNKRMAAALCTRCTMEKFKAFFVHHSADLNNIIKYGLKTAV